MELMASGIGLREAIELTHSWISTPDLAAIAQIAAAAHPVAATAAAAYLWDEWEGEGNPGSLPGYFARRVRAWGSK